jgi:hypothetical protein
MTNGGAKKRGRKLRNNLNELRILGGSSKAVRRFTADVYTLRKQATPTAK